MYSFFLWQTIRKQKRLNSRPSLLVVNGVLLPLACLHFLLLCLHLNAGRRSLSDYPPQRAIAYFRYSRNASQCDVWQRSTF